MGDKTQRRGVDMRDIAAVLGVAMITCGVALIHVPSALIVCGVLILAGAILAARR